MRKVLWMASLLPVVATMHHPVAAQVNLSFDGRVVNLTASNESYGSILDLLGRHTGMAVEIPGELKSVRVPLLEIRGLEVKATVLKIMEGSGFDYFLLTRTGRPDTLSRLIVSGKSKKIAPPARRSRPPSRSPRRPFVGRNVTPFNPRTGSGARTGSRAQKIKPAVQPKTTPTAQPATAFPVGQPYGQTLSSQPPGIGQPAAAQPRQVRSPRASGGQTTANPSRRAPNPYQRK
ncbi:MAG: hypothetical protein OXI69_08035 [Acidobacteriota bacterium]|nr:hypothetical protein [Acidobacteriota bacterium]